MNLTKHQQQIIDSIRGTYLKRRLNPEDVSEHEFVIEFARKLNHQFNLFDGEIIINPIQTDALWGMCEPNAGIIHLLFRWPGEDYRIERRTLLRVLCHEMAHFKMLGHPPDFFAEANKLIDFARYLTGDMKIKHERFIGNEYSTCGF